ncbi:MAG: quinol oxidase [Elusimicrobia bacterium]|nr:quinol oxidase [Elusimicrobiota bacterium]
MKNPASALTLALGLAGLAFAQSLPTATAVLGSDGIQRVEVVGGSYFFRPDHVVAKVNVPLELSLRKDSSLVPHDFILKDPEGRVVVSVSLSKEPRTARFTPTRPGKYEFYCGKKLPFLKSHRDKGMRGVLEVVE